MAEDNKVELDLPEGTLPLEQIDSVESDDDDGSFDIIFSEGGIFDKESTLDDAENEEGYFHEANLAEDPEFFFDEELMELGIETFENFESDRQSRGEWEQTIKKGLEQIGLQIQELQEPFEGACSATYPLILENAVKFQSKASAELFPARGPVRTQIMGNKTTEKEEKANRIQNHMNWQIMHEMPEYYPQGEKMLLVVALMGQGFKKLGFDPAMDTPTSEFVAPDQFVISNFEESLEKASRYSHIMYVSEVEMLKRINSGIYKEPSNGLTTPTKPEFNTIREKINKILGFSYTEGTEAEVFTLIEQHCYLDIGEDPEGYELPYIVTIEAKTQEVLSVRRNWEENDLNYKKLEWFSDYTFVPGFGFYGLGFIHLLGNLQLSLTTMLRSLVDSGQFANLQGGFKSKAAKLTGNEKAIAPGEWKEVEMVGADIQKAFLPVPFKEPSQTLFALLQFVGGIGQKFADSTEQVIADSSNYGPVGTTLALLEASTKFYTAIHKRLHFAQGKELKILARINRDYLPEEYPYDVIGESREIYAEDYNGEIEVIPVSDPNISSNAHRMSLAQAQLQLAAQFPDDVNKKPIIRRYLAAMNTNDINELVPSDEEAQQLDPISDIMAAVNGSPIKAFPGQAHEAHMQVKTSWVNDATQGGSPMMQQYVPVVGANIRDHQIMLWQEQMQGITEQMAPGETDPQVIEKVQAEAATEVLQANQRAAEEAADGSPAHILAQAELVKAMAEAEKVESQKEVNKAKAAKDIGGLMIDAGKLELEQDTLEFKREEAGVKATMTNRNSDADRAAAILKAAITNLQKQPNKE